MTKEKVAIVTGGSSGIGLQTARALNAAGCKVYEFSRRQICHSDGIFHVCADVSRESELCNAVKLVEQQEGHVDILVCNAGFGISGAAEFTDNGDARRLLDVNLFGVVNSVKAVLPVMRRQGGGRIVCISSVAAPIAIPFQSWYSVSKAAVSAYAAALREEVRPFGIQVSTILPAISVQALLPQGRKAGQARKCMAIGSGTLSRVWKKTSGREWIPSWQVHLSAGSH